MLVHSALSEPNLPADAPHPQILNLVHISPSYPRVEVGQTIPVTLSIRPTLTWSDSRLPEPLILSYDVTAKSEDWLVSGRKKGEFAARVSLRH